MVNYRLSNTAKADLIRIHQYGIAKFGMRQADNYFEAFFSCFAMIAQHPFSYEAVDHIKLGYRRCVCGTDSIYFKVPEDSGIVDIMAIVGRQDLSTIP